MGLLAALWLQFLCQAVGCRLEGSQAHALKEVLVALGLDDLDNSSADFETSLAAGSSKGCGSIGVFCEEVGTSCKVVLLAYQHLGLTGFLPEAIAGLPHLRKLKLSTNRLSGTIPKALGGLVHLREISFSRNQLTGEIPQELPESLEGLYLQDNHLTGGIPESFGRLRGLKGLDLSSNNLDGTIPESFENLVNLEHLWLSNNRLTGKLPALGNLQNLILLNVSQNHLEGKVPLAYRYLPEMAHADFRGNKLLPHSQALPNCAPFAKDPCQLFQYLDFSECLQCLGFSLGFAVAGAWCLRAMASRTPKPNSHVPNGAREVAAAALYPTRPSQTLYLALAVVAHFFAPCCMAWFVKPQVVLTLVALQKAVAAICSREVVAPNLLCLFFPQGLSARRRPCQTFLAELIGGPVVLVVLVVLVDMADLAQESPSFISQHDIVVAETIGSATVKAEFLPAICRLSLIYILTSFALSLCCPCGHVAPAASDVDRLARALASGEPVAQALEHPARELELVGEVRGLDAQGKGPADPVVRFENLGRRRLRASWGESRCEVQLLAAWRIYLDLGLTALTFCTDFFAAKKFLQGHFFWFAVVTLAASWCSMLVELPTWRNLRQEAQLSVRQGFYTDRMVALRNSERGVEGFLDLGVKVYGLPWGVTSDASFGAFLLGVLLNLRGLALVLRTRDQLAGYA
ncbi:unnamed protein product [Effrenium voratum]|uniref:Uncharacterized protein n=1 Tax=Effrenium voratum TaxID=2562239 RepID=A0AA36HY37_9DINO|nr:unnamed protein product [Effrenium voratum]CAJ1459987.1 unnamed protein product [Effrenium voratum]